MRRRTRRLQGTIEPRSLNPTMTPVFRNFVVKPLTILLFVLLIASFALWGIGDIFRGDTGPGTVIAVGEEEITEEEFSRNFRREFSRMSEMFDNDLDMQTAREIGIVDQIVNQMVTRALFKQQARDLGLMVGDSDVVREIRQEAMFEGPSGQFDRFRFEQALRQAGLSEAAYVNMFREEIEREHLFNAVTGGVRPPQAMAETIFRYENERRIADYLVLDSESFEVDEPSEQDLREFHADNPDEFMAPEYREVTYIHLSVEEMIAELDVPEEELRAEFEDRGNALGEPARRALRQIVLDSEEDAEAAAEQLRTGADFEEVAREFTGGSPADLGMNTRDDLLPELAEAAFETEEEGVRETPVETALGWHIIAVDEVEEGFTPEFEDVREDIRREVARDRAIDELVTMANRLDDELATGATLEQAAEFIGLETRHVPALDSQARDADGERVEDIPEPEDFVDVAFRTNAGEQSMLRETPDGGYYVLRVDGVRSPEVRPFEEVRDSVHDAFMAEQREQVAVSIGEDLLEDMERGTPLAEIGERHGVDVRTSQPLRRGNNPQAPEAERAMASAVFTASEGEATMTSFRDGVILAVPTEIQHADPQEASDELVQVRGRLGQSLRSDLLEQFSSAMREQYPVRVNEARMERVLDRFQ